MEDLAAMKEAMKSSEKEQGQKAIKKKRKSIKDNGAWTKTALSPGNTAIPCKTVFRRKLDDKSNLCRLKARLVAKFFFQKEGINYLETFAPVFLFEVLLLLAEKFVSEAWHVHHADITTAYLYVFINEELYMSWDNVFYKLKKCLYGWKQSPRLWYERLKKTLEGFGLKQNISCKSV